METVQKIQKKKIIAEKAKVDRLLERTTVDPEMSHLEKLKTIKDNMRRENRERKSKIQEAERTKS